MRQYLFLKWVRNKTQTIFITWGQKRIHDYLDGSIIGKKQMAKPEHLDKLKEGVEVWNEWRDDNPGIAPALWGADLEESDLRGADLKKPILGEPSSGALTSEGPTSVVSMSEMPTLRVPTSSGPYSCGLNSYRPQHPLHRRSQGYPFHR